MALRAALKNSKQLIRGIPGTSAYRVGSAFAPPSAWRQISASVAAVESPKKTGRRRIIDTKDPIVLVSLY